MFWLILLIPSLIGLAHCEQSALLQSGPSSANLWISPVLYNHTLLGPTFPAGGAAMWYLTQWDNPDELRNNTIFNEGPCLLAAGQSIVWSISTNNGILCVLSDNDDYIVQLAQNGDGLACGNEFDFFVSPDDGAYNNAPRNFQPFSLANRSAVHVRFQAEMVKETAGERCGRMPQCGSSGHVDYSYGVLGLTLSNPSAKQTLFYQVILSDSRQLQCPGANPCGNFTNWFFTQLPTLGVSDSIGYYDPALCKSHQGMTVFNLDVLKPLQTHIAQAAQRYGADPELNNWQMGGLYIGTGMEGNMATVFNVRDVNVVFT